MESDGVMCFGHRRFLLLIVWVVRRKLLNSMRYKFYANIYAYQQSMKILFKTIKLSRLMEERGIFASLNLHTLSIDDQESWQKSKKVV